MLDSHGVASRRGAYRLREAVTIVDDVVLSRQPLVATRLNDAALDLVAGLTSDEYRTPETLAHETGNDVDVATRLLDRLHDRSVLEWRPGRDPEFRPPVSVVVTVRDDRHNLERCLDALAGLSYPDYEVVVVDDGSTDGSRETAIQHDLAEIGSLRVVEVGSADDPLGIGASRNRGVAAAEHDVVAFTDADCRPTPDWLADLAPHLAAHDVVGGRIRPAGSSAASAYEGISSSLDMGPYATRVDPGGRTPYLATANLVGRKSVFAAVPFPARNVAEDVDVCWRALEAGYEVVYTPTGVVEHDYRDRLRDVVGRRSTYGASEALLAREYDHADATRVPLPVDGLLAATFAVLAIATAGSVATAASAVAVVAVAAGVLGRGWRTLRQYRRPRSLVTAGDVLRSRRRGSVSTAYAVAREVTRYYTGPLAVAALVVSPWLPIGATALASGVALSLAVPLAVEYVVHRPETTLRSYAAYYLADHLGYQYGLYRGAGRHRTLVHLDPRARFQLSGPGVGRLRNARLAERSSAAGPRRNL